MRSSRTLNGITGAIEVRVYQYGLVIAYEWCATQEEALAVADMWHRQRGVHCDIVRLVP